VSEARRSRQQRRADREAVGAYHDAQLKQLLERVREGFARYDEGAIDAFELDDLILRYKRATQKLWSSCVGSGAHVQSMARMLEWQRAEGEHTDWWELGLGTSARIAGAQEAGLGEPLALLAGHRSSVRPHRANGDRPPLTRLVRNESR
jgi:hypothetical protein